MRICTIFTSETKRARLKKANGELTQEPKEIAIS